MKKTKETREICIARGVVGGVVVEGVIIKITDDVPSGMDRLKLYDSTAFFVEDAERIYEALSTNLPGQTLAELVHIMIKDYSKGT